MKTTRRGLFGLLAGMAGVAALPAAGAAKPLRTLTELQTEVETTGSLVVEGGIFPPSFHQVPVLVEAGQSTRLILTSAKVNGQDAVISHDLEYIEIQTEDD